jgi:hypothetical protein
MTESSWDLTQKVSHSVTKLKKMYLSMQKLKQRIEMERLVGLKSLDLIIAEDWMAEITAVDVLILVETKLNLGLSVPRIS